jgi:hypothetical protein
MHIIRLGHSAQSFPKTMCSDSCDEIETKVPAYLESELTQLHNLHNILL